MTKKHEIDLLILSAPSLSFGGGGDVHSHLIMGEDDGEGDGQGQTGLLTKPVPKTKRPSMYKVLLLNDDYTPMEFVVHVLQRFFRMTVEQATQVMLHVHQRGVGVCGLFPYEVAETKVNQVMSFAQQHEHPLQCTLEKE